MATDMASLDELFAQAQKLSPDDRLLLIKMVAETSTCQQPSSKHQPLVYGQFHGARLSEEADFRIAEGL